jgi:uroporphyrinogen decarboxylase
MSDDRPSFERFLAAVQRRVPDRVPLGENWVDQEVKDAFMGHPVRTLAEDVEFWMTAGYDFVPVDVDLWATPPIQQAIASPLTQTSALYQGGKSERAWVAEDAKVIASWEDYERFPWPKASDVDCSPLGKLSQHLPAGVKAVVTTGHIFTGAWQLMGFERFCTNLYDQPDLVMEVVRRLGVEAVALTKRILTYDAVGAVWLQDDIAYNSGVMIPPQWLRRLFFPWLAEIAQLSHTAGRPFLFHTDGKVDMVMEDIIDAGVDLLHPIEPKCMDIVAIKQKYGHRVALAGNLDLGYVLTLGTPDEVREAVKHLLRHVAPGGGFLLGSANSVTNYVPLSNFKAMIETTLERGRYPIAL